MRKGKGKMGWGGAIQGNNIPQRHAGWKKPQELSGKNELELEHSAKDNKEGERTLHCR